MSDVQFKTNTNTSFDFHLCCFPFSSPPAPCWPAAVPVRRLAERMAEAPEEARYPAWMADRAVHRHADPNGTATVHTTTRTTCANIDTRTTRTTRTTDAGRAAEFGRILNTSTRHVGAQGTQRRPIS